MGLDFDPDRHLVKDTNTHLDYGMFALCTERCAELAETVCIRMIEPHFHASRYRRPGAKLWIVQLQRRRRAVYIPVFLRGWIPVPGVARIRTFVSQMADIARPVG